LRHTPVSIQQGVYELHSTTQTHPVLSKIDKHQFDFYLFLAIYKPTVYYSRGYLWY